jgi:hypothetical protein
MCFFIRSETKCERKIPISICLCRDLGGKELKVVSDPQKIKYPNLINISIQSIRTMFKYYLSRLNLTRPAWAGFKTAEEGRAKICKLLWQKL